MTTRFFHALPADERKKVESSVKPKRDASRKPVPVRKAVTSPVSVPRVVTLPDATGDCHIG